MSVAAPPPGGSVPAVARPRDDRTPPAGASRVGLRRLVAVELRKITSTYAVWGFLAAALLLCALAVASPIVSAADEGLDLASTEAVRRIFGAIGGGEVPALALGILLSAGEFRHGMAAQTFLAVPGRGRVLTAKVLAAGLAGVALALACLALALAEGLPWLAGKDAPLSIGDGELWRIAGGAVLATALYGVLGVAIGFLVRGLAAAQAIGIGWFLAVETAILAVWDGGGRYLPGGGASGLTRSPEGELLGQGASALLLLGWVAAFVVAAAWNLQRKDIDQ